MTVNNHILKSKYGVGHTVTSLLSRFMRSKELCYKLKWQDVDVKASDFQDRKVQEKRLGVFTVEDALDVVMLRLKKANASTKGNVTKSIPILEEAFSELSRVLKMKENEGDK